MRSLRSSSERNLHVSGQSGMSHLEIMATPTVMMPSLFLGQ